ncbi:TetR/AcrR family transcriptional regulator [Oceanobacillus bengalensis]|uniref:TetR/AcrR family transcriptional regulator n=1 Tax=Oceanobacillus bengalensis TaxID=1435466 RepID=A0A494Z7G5_9BACI|nr:TetR/AcrR family transcriptional regulator C-terminal domain-containing protein [Oceanobacillus bengalensis]RKQ18541.1 TetR/AcrR family transcriptional regulator [Oceanobacillus bengalensis]
MNQDLRVVKTKRTLQTAFIQLLQEKTLDKITVSELCRSSGITRRTFYLHYQNVTKYVEEIIESLLNELEQSMRRTTDYRLTTNGRLDPRMIYLFEHVYNNKEFYHIIFSRNSSFAYYEMFYKRIKVLVRNSMETMDFIDEINDFEVSYQANAILGIIMEWYYGGFEKSIDEMNHILMSVLKRYRVF